MDCAPRIADLVAELRAYHGYRTLWIDQARGLVLHAEPDDQLEARGYRYVATLMRPGPEVLAEALGRAGVRPAATEARTPGLPWPAVTEPASI